jgi:hypothetical protein
MPRKYSYRDLFSKTLMPMTNNTVSRHENVGSSDITTSSLRHDEDSVVHESDAAPHYRQFLLEFFRTKGAIQLVILSSLTGFGIGSVVGLVRSIK